MYPIPPHILALINRIIREYETLCHQGYKITLHMFRNNRLYSGTETTEYCLQTVRHFKQLLISQDPAFFSGTEWDIRRKIYSKICEFCIPLPEKAKLRINRTIECQGQLDRALLIAKKDSATASDATQLGLFIANAGTLNWCEEDKELNHRVFKLIRSEEAFEKLVDGSSKYPTIEITQLGTTPYMSFRIALQTIDVAAIYRKQVKVREFRNFWNSAENSADFDTDYLIFNMWNGIKDMGVYYVYIPRT